MNESTTSPHPEAEAVEAVLNGTATERLRIGAAAMVKLLKDPEDTQQVLIAGLVANYRRFPEFLARFTATEEGCELMRDRPVIDSSSVDYDELRALPAGTLGREYVRYLDENSLDPDIFQPPPGMADIPAYVSQRMRQVHDLWHVLTGYDTSVQGEVALQAFTYGNTGMPSSGWIAVVGSARFVWRHPAILKLARQGYRRGRQADFLAPVRWEHHWDAPVNELRARYSIADH